MRWSLNIGLSLLLLLLLGCGGGGGGGSAMTAPPANLLEASYLDSLTNIPTAQGGGTSSSSEVFQVSAKLLAYSGAPMTHLTFGIPYNGTTLGMAGPYALPITDGDWLGTTPIQIYWGSHTSVPAQQPLLLLPGQMEPGYSKPTASLSIYDSSTTFNSPVPIAGAYFMAADNGIAQTWQAPADRQMVAPVKIDEPSIIAVDSLQSIHVTWEPVAGAIGYLVTADSLHDTNNANGPQVVWTSANQPLYFDAVDNYVPYLLPSSVLAVDIPANIFANDSTILIRVLAHGNPYTVTTTSPNLRMVSGAITNQVYALFEE